MKNIKLVYAVKGDFKMRFLNKKIFSKITKKYIGGRMF